MSLEFLRQFFYFLGLDVRVTETTVTIYFKRKES